MTHPLIALWITSCRPAPNWQGKAKATVVPPTPRDGTCALTGVRGLVWPLSKITTTLTTLDRFPHRDSDPKGLALGEAAAWAVRHRVAMQQPHVAVDGGPLVEAAPADLYAALVGMTPESWVLVPQSRQKHLLPYASPGVVQVDDRALAWGAHEMTLLLVYAELRAAGFGETAIAERVPRWPILTKCSDQKAVLRAWPALDPWRASPAYLDVAARATRQPK